jgi:hypothetical protein
LSTDLHDPSPPRGPTKTALDSEASGENTLAVHGYPTLTPYTVRKARASNSAGIEGNSQPANVKAGSSFKGNLELTGRAVQTVLKKAVDIVDTNPVKVTLGLVKAIIEMKNVRHCISQRVLITDCYSRP